MEVNIEIGGGAKVLDEGDGAGLGLIPCQAGLVDHKGGEGAVDDLQHGREQLRLSGEQMPQRDGKGDHPLAYRHVRDHLFNQMGRGLRHASGATAGAKPSAVFVHIWIGLLRVDQISITMSRGPIGLAFIGGCLNYR